MLHKWNNSCPSVFAAPPEVFFYTGPSMNPTLKAGDLLHLAQYGDSDIRNGDVIIFRPDGMTNAVTHRVVSIDGECVRTRGDNNDGADPWIITREQVLGRVVAASRDGRSRSVHGGMPGRIQGNLSTLRRSTRKKLYRLAQPTYRRISAWGVFRWLARRMETRIVSFKRPGLPPELHLQMAGRVIGRLLPGEERWRIKPPFRLLVNEDTLPGNDINSLPRQSAGANRFPFSE
jgi:hypothetical protein